MAQGQATKVKKKKKSVLKRAAQAGQRAEVNRANRTRVRTLIKRLRTAISAGDAGAAGTLLQPTLSAIDVAISKGVLHENTGNRYKSRLALAFNGVKAAKAYRSNCSWFLVVSCWFPRGGPTGRPLLFVRGAGNGSHRGAYSMYGKSNVQIASVAQASGARWQAARKIGRA